MMLDQFKAEMDRLAGVFGAGAYPTPRLELIWREVNPYSIEWFKKLIDQFIGTMRHAPLLPDFVEAAAIERERVYEKHKSAERQAFRAAERVVTGKEKELFAAIRARADRALSDEEWEKVQQEIEQMKEAESQGRKKA